MKKLFSAILLLLLSMSVSGERYLSEHFEIISDLDSRYVEILQKNVEGYYDNMVARFFDTGWDEPLKIYYFESQSDTQNYLGNDYKMHYGIYIPSRNAIFTHRKMDDGDLAGLGTVFHEITHHFVRHNYKNPPTWFNEGLTCFLSEQSRLIQGYLKIGHPNLWREHALREMIENGTVIDVRHYTKLNGDSFYRNRSNYHPVRALFYWVYSMGMLEDYLQNVQHNGYGLDVLESSVGMDVSGINEALLTFIQQYCYAGAYVQDSHIASAFEEKEKLLQASLNLYPRYSRAQLELGKLYYYNKDNGKCQDVLLSLLNDNRTVEYKDANLFLARSYYAQKKVDVALSYYEKAIEYSLCDEYHYQIYFWIGNCHVMLGNKDSAVLAFEQFLQYNWEPERLAEWCKFAQNYLDKQSL